MKDDLAPIYGDLLAKLLNNRNVYTIDAAEEFLNPKYESTIHSPFLMKDMDRATERLLEALCSGEQITIFGDYDCDGIPGAAIMSDYFRAIGANFNTYIPHRHKEGYGLSCSAIDSIKDRGSSLIVTVDLGITACDEVEYARAIGVDVIITDHHLPLSLESEGELVQRIPDALAVINTKQNTCKYPDKSLCGAATAWKLICALHMKLSSSRELLPENLCKVVDSVPVGFEKWLLDLVAIATVADMVPLTGENRTLVKYGLIVLNKTKRVGLRELIRKAGLRLGSVQEDDIAFTIAPRINAASRMDDPILAFRLLDTIDEVQAKDLSVTLDKLNETRKSGVAQIMKQLYDVLEHRDIGPVLVVGNSDWSPGVLGLIASKLVEKYGVTVFVWGQAEDGVLKGSCRSDGSVSVIDLMSLSTPSTFEHYGGHELAGGFAVSHEKVHTLEKELTLTYSKTPRLETSPDQEKTTEEHVTQIHEMNSDTYTKLSKLSPHGMSNPKPIFKIVGIGTLEVGRFGKSKEHLKLKSQLTGNIEIVYFFPKNMPEQSYVEVSYIIGNLEESVFMGKRTLRFRVIDMH